MYSCFLKVSGSIYSVSAFKDLYFVKEDIKYYSKLTSMVWIRFYISLYLRCKRTQREHEVISKCSWFAFLHSAFMSCWWRSWTESKCLKTYYYIIMKKKSFRCISIYHFTALKLSPWIINWMIQMDNYEMVGFLSNLASRLKLQLCSITWCLIGSLQ